MTGAALLAVALAAVGGPQSAHGWSKESRTCTTAELQIALVHSGVAAGTVGGYIGFTNRTRRACSLTGWPALVAVTAAGDTTTARHRRATMFGPRPNIKGFPVITIRRGQRADAVFTGTDIAGPGKTTCGRPYRYLRVTPPDNSHSVLVSAWLPALDAYLPRCGRIDVSMVVRASALYHG